MTAQKSMRRRITSLLATGTAALLAASGLALAPTAAFAEDVATPTVTVSKTTGLNPEGEQITVSGSGFAPAGSATNGTRPPLAGKFGGAYVVFGSFLDAWKPSEGAPSSARKVLSQKWAVSGSDMAIIGGPEGGAVEVSPEGTFSTTLTVSKDDAAALADGNYGIYTYPGSGVSYAPFETYTPISFTEAPAAPTVAANVTAASTSGLTVAANFTGANGITIPAGVGAPGPSAGVYAALVEAGTSGDLSMEDQGIAAAFVPNAQISGGAGSATLSPAKADLDRSKSYEVLFWYAHSNPVPETIIGVVPLTVTAAQWDAVFPKPVDPKPTVKFTDVKSGDKFYKEISWMAVEGISTGVRQKDGSLQYQPKNNVTREAMAAFLYRAYGEKNFTAPAKSPFTDVKPGDKFYKEISWMAAKGISTGVRQPDGSKKYQPKSGITREAMAAFMYRLDTDAKPRVPASSPFADMKPGDKFYKEIAWMWQAKLSTGNKQPSGKPTYSPKSNVTREAMAAFLYRADAR
ncbi:S-layer homology domain-containing protein [Leucobacter massiliensis]|uniref:SLH domain-containing protein n=1 Tax=Leucobacter massiliensis TaxID=1686285 RepID=A0A2S9QL01_9MICO|nr:S-layer homology domain-containing protein [Leucobacter massiliensis]PRI10264.1 hypothetical protein B4915_12780 [Leucobacter massiliensis]